MTGSSSLKAYAKGSKCPPPIPGKMRLYNMRFCPYALRPKLVLLAKNIDFEEVNINLTAKPEWFFEKNPLGLVPAIELDGRLLGESLVITDYLDEAYPDIPLHPKDPFEKAKNAMIVARFNKFHSIVYNITFGKEKDKNVSQLWENALKELEYLETELSERGTKFLFGDDKPGIVDYMIWPFLMRVPVYEALFDISPLPAKRFPKIIKYLDDLNKDGAVVKSGQNVDSLIKFYESKLNGSAMPAYDDGLE